MGLQIHSLGELPTGVVRAYYLYLLDYGWHESLGQALADNFSRMADLASRNNAVVLRGVPGVHFDDEVLSWHQINGDEDPDLLPAILVTNKHPEFFRGLHPHDPQWDMSRDRLLIIPLKRFCRSTTEVVNLVDRLFRDIAAGKALTDFTIARQIKGGTGLALLDALILQPNFSGLGLDLKKVGEFFRRKRTAT